MVTVPQNGGGERERGRELELMQEQEMERRSCKNGNIKI